MVTTLTIAPISEAPVRQGEEELRPVLVAPGAFGEWTIACWSGRDWYDRGVQDRRSGQRPAFPGWLQDCEAPVEAEKEHGSPLCGGCTGRLHAGFRHRKGQQKFSEKRRVGLRAVQLRSRIRQVYSRSQPFGLRTRVPCGRESEGPHLPPVPEAVNRVCSRLKYYPEPLRPSLRLCELRCPFHDDLKVHVLGGDGQGD